MRGESPFLKPPRDDDADDEIGSRWSLFVVVAGIGALRDFEDGGPSGHCSRVGNNKDPDGSYPD